MGVRGLTTYITSNEDLFLKDFRLHDCTLVIDGHSLCAQLYQRLTCYSAFGGEYDKFAAYVRKFFLSLRKCKITSYVLFDGSHERRKLRTAYSRLRNKLSGVARLFPGNQSSLKIFPLLIRDVFKEVLADMKIPHTVCEFEADDEIAALARHLNCPVLSYDSDFFIYNVLYVPFNTIMFKPVTYEEDGQKIHVIECKLYRVENFLNHFGGLREELLPLLGTLLGNDYVKKKVFKNFFSHLKLPKSRKKKNEQQRSIQALVEWLRNETLESAVLKIIDRMKRWEKHRVLFIMTKSCNGYNKKNCESLKYFNLVANEIEEVNILNVTEGDLDMGNDETSDEEIEEESSSDAESSDTSEQGNNIATDDQPPRLPAWIVKGIRDGSIQQPYINLYTHGLYFCIPQAEDCNDKDALLVCLPILRFSFDILTNFTEGILTYIGREGSQYTKIDVPVDIALKPPVESPSNPLEDHNDKLHEYFEYFLKIHLQGMNFENIDMLPDNFKLTMIAILWWIKHCRVTTAQIYSLFLGYVMLEVVDEKTGSHRGDYFFNNKYANKLADLKKRPITIVQFDESQLLLNKNKISYEDCLITASVFIKMFEMESEMMKRPKTYDLQRIHGFAQFQCCLQHINYLNALCNSKYEPTHFHRTYNGLLAYNILNQLSDRVDPMSYVEQHLKGADTVLLFFKSLCFVLDKNIQSLNLTVAAPVGKPKRRGGRKKRGKDIISFLCEAFESEVII